MLRNSLPTVAAAASVAFDDVPPPSPQVAALLSISAPSRLGGRTDKGSEPKDDVISPAVVISPPDSVRRHQLTGRGMAAEFVQSTSRDRIEFRFRASSHLLVAYEQGARRDGETFVEGMARSTLRDFTQKLTFVPAGHGYCGWHQPRTPTRLMYFYFDASEPQAKFSPGASEIPFAPRLFFEDAMLWNTVFKLKGLVETPLSENRPYFEALGTVLVHELVRLHRGVARTETRVRGGLAAWQQRIVTTYIEEHLPEHIPLAQLAQLAQLSPYHFSRAFKQSLGIPPHRFHTSRRIEHAKVLLEKRALSVTDIGMTLGFSETSSFTAAFRKTTGLTPTGYCRSL